MNSNIYKNLEKYFNDNLINIAKDLNYSEDNILILENNISLLKSKYPDVYSNLESCVHNRDKRDELTYAKDLICSWIFEDYLIYYLKNKGLDIKLNGTDYERKILKSSKIKSSSDYVIVNDNKNFYIELMNSYTNYWNEKKKCDLRDDKYKKLKKLIGDNNYSLLLGIDFYNDKFFLVDMDIYNYSDKDVHIHPSYGCKPAQSLDIKNIQYYNFSFLEIYKKIMEFIDKK